jgi:chaperone modulatory protein CbpM
MTDPISAMLLDESVELSLEELCAACRLSEDLVMDIVAEGIVEPLGATRAQWRFSGVAVTRIQRVIRLQQDFDVNRRCARARAARGNRAIAPRTPLIA